MTLGKATFAVKFFAVLILMSVTLGKLFTDRVP
jgi:hypothetical protein